MVQKNKLSAKRIQVDNAKATLMVVLAGASILTVFALVASKTYFSQASYLNRVASEKEKAVDQLKKNTEAVSTLVDAYKVFASADPNLLGGTIASNGERDGDNARLVLDALPSKYDFPALATSIEKLLAGIKIHSITGTDDAIVQQGSNSQDTVEIPFTIDVASDYTSLQQLVGKFERSIRPFQVTSLELGGTNSNIQSILKAKTYYQPERSLTIEKKVVR